MAREGGWSRRGHCPCLSVPPPPPQDSRFLEQPSSPEEKPVRSGAPLSQGALSLPAFLKKEGKEGSW